jgi:hypothetical protein
MTEQEKVTEEKAAKKTPRPEMVTVIAKRMLQLTLDHDLYCAPLGQCFCVNRVFKGSQFSKQTGMRGYAAQQKKFPPTITLPAMMRAEIPKESLGCLQIQAAIRVRDLRVVPVSKSFQRRAGHQITQGSDAEILANRRKADQQIIKAGAKVAS